MFNGATLRTARLGLGNLDLSGPPHAGADLDILERRVVEIET
ncbi:MAG TPA: hypothetical protein VGK94_08570 [Candidatus Polarisedimenticolia bacterium]|jgi:hypothetical protein